MNAVNPMRDVIVSLADVYAGEDRDGARELVDALTAGADSVECSLRPPYALDATIVAASEGASHPLARAARAAHSFLPWSATGILDNQIPSKVSDVFAVASLIGTGALIESDTVRAGLFVMRSGAFYPAHAHAAEETYVMLAGEAEWQRDFGEWETRSPGEVIHHPGEAVHATRTGALPILAAWRWSGDVRTETYRMVDAA